MVENTWGHLSYLPGEEMIDEFPEDWSHLYMASKKIEYRKATFKQKNISKRKHEVYRFHVKKSISRPLCVSFCVFLMAHIRWMSFFWGGVRGFPPRISWYLSTWMAEIDMQRWSLGETSEGSQTVRAVDPVIFDDPWVLVGYIWGHYLCDTYVRQVYCNTLLIHIFTDYLHVCGKYSWSL